MIVTRGLVIGSPWIEHILAGRKDWEMRSQATSHRGWFGLIRKGSGHVVGLARLVDCGKTLSQSEMIANIDHHRIPEDMILRGEVAKWNIPWKLAEIIPLERSIPYEHKSGAVIWVTFTPEVTRQLDRCIVNNGAPAGEATSHPARTVDQYKKVSSATALEGGFAATRNPAAVSKKPLSDGGGRVLGRSRLTGGNVRNDHINLSQFLDAFPQDVIGGRNKAEAAIRQVRIDWGGPQPVMTDIDRTKSIFRGRGWVRRFLSASDAHEGDVVIVTETAPYQISVRLERKMSKD